MKRSEGRGRKRQRRRQKSQKLRTQSGCPDENAASARAADMVTDATIKNAATSAILGDESVARTTAEKVETRGGSLEEERPMNTNLVASSSN